MKYLHDIQAEEDQAQEQKYLEEIGQIGRLFDDHLYFCVIIFLMGLAGFMIGIGIGAML